MFRKSPHHTFAGPVVGGRSDTACTLRPPRRSRVVLVPHCRTDPRAVKGVALRVRARDIVREKEATVTRRRHGLRARPRARLLASALGCATRCRGARLSPSSRTFDLVGRTSPHPQTQRCWTVKRTRETLARRWSQVASRVSVRALSMIASRRRRRTLVVVAGVGCVPSRASSRRSGNPSARSCRPNVTAWAPRADVAPPPPPSPPSLAAPASRSRRTARDAVPRGNRRGRRRRLGRRRRRVERDARRRRRRRVRRRAGRARREFVAPSRRGRGRRRPLALARARHPSRRPASHHLASHHLASRRPSP